MSAFYKPAIGLSTSYLHIDFLIIIFTTNLQINTLTSNYYYLYFTDEEAVAQRGLSSMGYVVTQPVSESSSSILALQYIWAWKTTQSGFHLLQQFSSTSLHEEFFP